MYGHVVQRAASAGLIRRAFFREAEAREWLADTLRTLAANQAGWFARR